LLEFERQSDVLRRSAPLDVIRNEQRDEVARSDIEEIAMKKKRSYRIEAQVPTMEKW